MVDAHVAVAGRSCCFRCIAFAQVKRTNPPALSKPTGYTHVVEVTGPAKTIYIAGQIALDKDGKSSAPAT